MQAATVRSKLCCISQVVLSLDPLHSHFESNTNSSPESWPYPQIKSTSDGLSCSWLISKCYHCMTARTRILLPSQKHHSQRLVFAESFWMPFWRLGDRPYWSLRRIWSEIAFPSKPCWWAPALPPLLAWNHLSLLQTCRQAVHLMPQAAVMNVQEWCATMQCHSEQFCNYLHCISLHICMLTMLWDANSNLPDKMKYLDELESNLQPHSFFYLLNKLQPESDWLLNSALTHTSSYIITCCVAASLTCYLLYIQHVSQHTRKHNH